MKNQIKETNTVLNAIKNSPNENQPELAQLENPSADLLLTIGHNASHILAKICKKDYERAYGVKYDGANFFIGSKRVEIVGDDLPIDGEELDMSRNVWKLLILANLRALNEYPEEGVSKYEKLMFKTIF